MPKEWHVSGQRQPKQPIIHVNCGVFQAVWGFLAFADRIKRCGFQHEYEQPNALGFTKERPTKS